MILCGPVFINAVPVASGRPYLVMSMCDKADDVLRLLHQWLVGLN